VEAEVVVEAAPVVEVDPAEVVETAPASAKPPEADEATAVVRIPFDLSGGRTFTAPTPTVLIALARSVLPGLRILSADLEVNASGATLVAGFAGIAAVTL
jgi:hypothetical protein